MPERDASSSLSRLQQSLGAPPTAVEPNHNRSSEYRRTVFAFLCGAFFSVFSVRSFAQLVYAVEKYLRRSDPTTAKSGSAVTISQKADKASSVEC